ncbi:hypothetical protein CRE_10958 [Caenorhabditis remanei]|uniref:Serpin domain-containing protein n=1 Tax=Caenorhabditis remanei TaxID=31234 RepID=E3M5R1_CAERE|nr:hypothetical protein CRE_10958 [Caenorhabditis remanei]
MRRFVSFYVFLPKIRFGLQNALKNLGDGEQLYHLINTANEKYVDVKTLCFETRKKMYFQIRVPRFKIDTEADLGSFINSIGIEKGLYEDVSNKVLGKTPRFVHKVQFELDVQRYKKFEDGFNRDCTGVVDLGFKYISDICQGPKLEFLADHPFLFMHVKDTHVVYFGCYQ